MIHASSNGQVKKTWTAPKIIDTQLAKDARSNQAVNIVDGQINVGSNTQTTLGS